MSTTGGGIRMTDQQAAIVDRCIALGIDQHGLASIRNFIEAAFYHVHLPGTLPADKHLAFNTAIRHATNRIACQGRHGIGRGMSRVLSRGAVDLREAILRDEAIPRCTAKIARWMKQVTEEHQDPVAAVEKWITECATRTVDDVVERLLAHPSVIVTREEEKQIANVYRRGGIAAERYKDAKIETMLVDQGTYAFFSSRLLPDWSSKPGTYHVERSEWPISDGDARACHQ
jgi:hypothetical protein